MRAREFVKDFRHAVTDDHLIDVAAMMTYYAIFALFPMAIFVITVALLIVPPEALTQATQMATQAMPGEASQLVTEQVTRMQQAAGGGIALGAAALALWGASRGSVALGRALNSVLDCEENRPWWKVQLTGIGMTLVVAALLITALGLLVIGPAVGSWLAEKLGMGAAFEVVWTVARWIGAALLVMLIWALLYRYLPDTEEPMRIFTPGAAVGVILWIGVSLLFALWVSNFGNYDRSYGALGTVMVFLTWLWLSNLAMLTGAEINDVLRRERLAHEEEELA